MSEGGAGSMHLSFLQSACGAADGAIRLAEEKLSYALMCLGTLAAILSCGRTGS